MIRTIHRLRGQLGRSLSLLAGYVALLVATVCASAYAETKIVVGEGASDVCWGTREAALKIARVDANNDAHDECRALGPGWTFSGIKFTGYEQCTQCGKSQEFRCKVTQATYECKNPRKENEEKAAKARAEKEAADKAAKGKADREKAEREAMQKLAKEKADRERAEKEAAAKAAKEKTDRELAAKKAKEKADKDKADQERAEKEAIAKAARENADREAAEKRAKDKADKESKDKADRERADKIAKDKEAAKTKAAQAADKKKPATEANPIDDAFARMEAQTGRSSVTKTGNIDDEFEKVERYRSEQERLRIAAAKARQEREAATQFCESAFKVQEGCVQTACGRKPSETICTQSRQDEIPPCVPRYPSDCQGSRIIFPTYTCISTGSNPAYSKWETCTANLGNLCAPKETSARNAGECVEQRLRTSKGRQ